MLVLARREQQRIIIDGRITVTVVRIHAEGEKKVKIGIDAPPGVTVDREEIYWARIRDPRPARPPEGGGPTDGASD